MRLFIIAITLIVLIEFMPEAGKDVEDATNAALAWAIFLGAIMAAIQDFRDTISRWGDPL